MSEYRTDAELLAATGSDPRAFCLVYDRHAGAVNAYLSRQVGALSEDLTAEVFAQGWLSRNRFRDEAKARPYRGCSGSRGTSSTDPSAHGPPRTGPAESSGYPSREPSTPALRPSTNGCRFPPLPSHGVPPYRPSNARPWSYECFTSSATTRSPPGWEYGRRPPACVCRALCADCAIQRRRRLSSDRPATPPFGLPRAAWRRGRA